MADRKTQGINATNQAFIRYDQVDKKQEYHLAEGKHEEAFDDETRVQTCDLGRFLHGNEADQRAFAGELGAALRSLGFAILEGHGISPSLYREAEERTEDLFATTSLAGYPAIRLTASAIAACAVFAFCVRFAMIISTVTESWFGCQQS